MSISSLPPLSREMRLNFQHLYADIGWFGVLAGSTSAFLGIYMARLGASTYQLGLLSAAPALVNLFISLPAGRFLEKQPIIKTTFLSSIAQRLGFLALVPLPWVLAEPGQVWGVIWITLLMSIPGTLLAISFNALFADLVSPDWRAHVVGRRNALIAIVTTLVTLLSGQILDWVVFPLNYQIVFMIGALGAFMSCYHLARLTKASETPVRIGRPAGDFFSSGIWRLPESLKAVGLRFLTRSQGRSLLRPDMLKGPFGVFMGAYLIFYIFQNIPLPLFSIYSVNNLNMTDGQISLGTAIFNLMVMLISLRLNTISSRRGHRFVLVAGALTFCIYPLILWLARDYILYWAASFAGGAVWGILAGGLVNRLMERVPANDRPAHMALHNMVANLGVLVGSLVGPELGNLVGIHDALLYSAGLRLLGGIVLVLWG